MASVTGSNTSKTAHVMTLLSRSRGTESPLPTDSAATSAALPEDPTARAPYSDILQNDMAVSSAVRTLCRHPWRKQKHQLLLVPCPNTGAFPFTGKSHAGRAPFRGNAASCTSSRGKDAETQPPAEPLSSPAVCETTCENIMQLLVEEKADRI
ncbi:MAG: hypothetical protein ACLRNW_24675 [Neglectibacter sp.]